MANRQPITRSPIAKSPMLKFPLPFLLLSLFVFHASASDQLTVTVEDFVALPITGSVDGTGQTDGMLARVNTIREEPGGGKRLFVNDMNGPLFIVDKETKK